MKQPRKVALLIETSNAYARGLLHGIVSYLREHQPWSLHLAEHTRGDRPPSWLAGWEGDGVIARIENEAIAHGLRRLKIPVIDVSAARLLPRLPWFETDNTEFARLAYGHLAERGFKHFAYCGEDRFPWSRLRGAAFAGFARAAGHEVFTHQAAKNFAPDDEGQIADIATWLQGLPKPVGVMACYDLRGQQVLDACRRAGLTVPEEVAVIGADDDELLCELSSPPLSSVIPDTHRTGYEAAALLDRLMAGEKVPPGTTRLIPPLGLTTRQSTDVLAIDDSNLAKALHFIRDNACRDINVSDVLRAVPQSRRIFESRFKKLTGRTPHDEIVRVQINRVKELLTGTNLPLDQIAGLAGFAHVEYLSVVFKKKTGMPPGKYRTRHLRPARAPGR